MNNANYQDQAFQKAATGNYVVLLSEACENKGAYSEAYPTGFSIFDNAMIPIGTTEKGGLRGGDLMVITGKTKHGKTTLAQNIALNFNKIAIPVLFFSYEVKIDNIYAKFKQMGFSDDGVILAPKKIISGNMRWIIEKAKEAKEKYYAKALIIDHVEYLSPADNSSEDQLRVRLKDICRELKMLANSEDLIIILLAHVKKMGTKQFDNEDIAESSGIPQQADYILSVERFEDEVKMTTGKTMKIQSNKGVVRMTGNRLSGETPYMEFTMNNNIIMPLYDL